MKNKLLLIMLVAFGLLVPKINFGQAPTLGNAGKFVLFTSVGAMGNTGISHLTGNVGSNVGAITGFGNVDGVMQAGGVLGGLATVDLLSAYAQLNAALPDFLIPVGLGGGQILVPGTYAVAGPAVLGGDLILDAGGDPNAVFIIQIPGTFATDPESKVKLKNGAVACNVFWKVEGAISMAVGTSMKGTMIANNGAIHMSQRDTLEGRALTTNGGVTVDGVMAYMPLGCSTPVLTGPAAPDLKSISCYALFSSIGPVTNVGITHVIGDIGSNSAAPGGFNPLFVTGSFHSMDGSTSLCASDLTDVYNNLDAETEDIILLYPAQFGNNLVLTPHTYLMNGAVTFTDSLYLNAQGNANAQFLIKVKGAFSTSTYSKVLLINGAQAKNVHWVVDGAVSINDYSIFNGTIVCNMGAVNLTTGVTMNGRVLTTTGAVSTTAVDVFMTPGCGSLPADSINMQPNNQTVCLGDTAKFSVGATGVGLTYQWRKGNVNINNGGNISGANSDTLVIFPATVLDTASNYNVIVFGSPNDTSINVSLTVNSLSSITTQPSSKNTCNGATVSFSVQANGTGLTYQWRNGNVNLMNAGNISGADSDTLKISPTSIADTSSYYNVIVSGACGADTSNNAFLNMNGTFTIDTQPNDQTVCSGSTATFAVSASGTGLTYQWRKGNVILMNLGNISGADSDSLKISPATIADTSSYYNVIVSGTCGVDTSNNASLNMNGTFTINTQPNDQAVCSGSTATFAVSASGTGLSYQWRKGNVNLMNAGNISGADSDSLKISPATIADTSSYYNVIVSGTCGADTSMNASLNMNSPTNINTQPSEQGVCSGTVANFSVNASGTGLTYQWRKGNVNLMNIGNISGANSDTLKIDPATTADTASNYNVIVYGACSNNDTSMNAVLRLNNVKIITEPSDLIVCDKGFASFTVATSGIALNYQWIRGSINLIDTGNISGSNAATLVLNPANLADASSNYEVIVNGACASSDTSNYAILMVNTPPNITTEPYDQTACDGNTVNFSVIATGVDLTYQWRIGNVFLVSGGNIADATAPTLIINPISPSDYTADYSVIVSGTCFPSDTSVSVALIPNNPVIITEPKDQITCTGNSVGFKVVSTGTGLSYQWRRGNVNLMNTANISGVNTDSLTFASISTADTASNYNVFITGVCSPNDTSINVSLTIDTAQIITSEPANQIVCSGNAASFSITAIGVGLNYQWRKGNVNLNNSGNISGANTSTLSINPANVLDSASTYNVYISGTCGINDTSLNASLVVNDLPIIEIHPANQIVCEGSSANFTVSATGTGIAYQWRKGAVNILGANSATYTINPVNVSDTSSYYNVIVSGTCAPSDTSVNVSLMLNTVSIVSQPGNQTACVGGSANFVVDVPGTGLTYQWRKGNTNIFGETASMLTLTSISIDDSSSYYNVIVSGTCLSKDTSINVSLTVNTIPVALASTNAPQCAGNAINLNAQMVVGGTYAWTGPNGYTSATKDSVISTSTFAHAGTYSLTVSTNGCNSTPSTVAVVVNDCSADLKVVKTVNNPNPLVGRRVVFTIVVSNNGPMDATGVTITDVLQNGYTYVSSTGTYNETNGVWTIGTLDSGASETVTITAIVNSTGSYTNTATVAGNEIDLNLVNNTSTTETSPTDFNIPEGFSPNGDGINDLFVIRGIQYFPGNTLEIFNRWGDKVYSGSEYMNTWNGKASSGLIIGGDELQTATYFYTLDLADGSNVIKGTIYLNK